MGLLDTFFRLCKDRFITLSPVDLRFFIGYFSWRILSCLGSEGSLLKKALTAPWFALFFLASCVTLGNSVPIRLLGSTNDVASINGYLGKPRGKGPFPAVILMHGCGGVRLSGAGGVRNHRWVEMYRKLGYVTLIPDSFTSRGWYGCRNRDPNSEITFKQRVADAYSALMFLSKQSFVDKDQVVLEGLSHGGNTVLQAITAQDPTGQNGKFAAGIAFYPNCRFLAVANIKFPLLILTGDKDMSKPSLFCPLPSVVRTSFEYRLKIYPGATHGFDFDLPPRTFRGDYREFSPQATADSEMQIRQFLARHVKPAGR
jgi:dienelactone hydrolase